MTVGKNRCPLQRAPGKDFVSAAIKELDDSSADFYVAENNGSTKLMTGFEKDFYMFTN